MQDSISNLVSEWSANHQDVTMWMVTNQEDDRLIEIQMRYEELGLKRLISLLDIFSVKNPGEAIIYILDSMYKEITEGVKYETPSDPTPRGDQLCCGGR